jgi:hypothetical protein
VGTVSVRVSMAVDEMSQVALDSDDLVIRGSRLIFFVTGWRRACDRRWRPVAACLKITSGAFVRRASTPATVRERL